MHIKRFRIATRVAACLVAALLGPTCQARDDPGPIVTDRPDQTESAEVVPRGLVQIEAGYSFVHVDQDGEVLEASAIPSTLVRWGLDPKVELRFGWVGYVSEEREVAGVDTDDSGSGNTSLGAKIKLREERGRAPQLAILVDFVLPTGHTALRSDRIDPSARVCGSHTLSERMGFGWNLGIAAVTTEDAGGEPDTDTLGIYTAALGIGITERWSAFVELFGGIPFSGSADPANLFDGGFTYLVSDNVQLDLSGGVGLNDHADDWFMGAGISFRLPR